MECGYNGPCGPNKLKLRTLATSETSRVAPVKAISKVTLPCRPFGHEAGWGCQWTFYPFELGLIWRPARATCMHGP